MNRALELACIIFMTPGGLEGYAADRLILKKHTRRPKGKKRRRTRWKTRK